jgi:hypothetical protein
MVNIAASFSVNFTKPYCVYFLQISGGAARQQQFTEGAVSVVQLGAANISSANY